MANGARRRRRRRLARRDIGQQETTDQSLPEGQNQLNLTFRVPGRLSTQERSRRREERKIAGEQERAIEEIGDIAGPRRERRLRRRAEASGSLGTRSLTTTLKERRDRLRKQRRKSITSTTKQLESRRESLGRRARAIT